MQDFRPATERCSMPSFAAHRVPKSLRGSQGQLRPPHLEDEVRMTKCDRYSQTSAKPPDRHAVCMPEGRCCTSSEFAAQVPDRYDGGAQPFLTESIPFAACRIPTTTSLMCVLLLRRNVHSRHWRDICHTTRDDEWRVVPSRHSRHIANMFNVLNTRPE